ncbi:hypothetical protein DICVIV_10554 [Dictyocaulus viviparus]|uniref:Uncharacterized protein n=1 Tax=Dictyocaulus viviparus TaxID=29172 RepID=A0A0D8XFJ6_DICVI|nr:hypothetical protein DICVIV_10554 [Dictyocaulus viviparus]
MKIALSVVSEQKLTEELDRKEKYYQNPNVGRIETGATQPSSDDIEQKKTDRMNSKRIEKSKRRSKLSKDLKNFLEVRKQQWHRIEGRIDSSRRKRSRSIGLFSHKTHSKGSVNRAKRAEKKSDEKKSESKVAIHPNKNNISKSSSQQKAQSPLAKHSPNPRSKYVIPMVNAEDEYTNFETTDAVSRPARAE